jgi:Cu(I)/Ag(I) efflux system membrane fusion protein
MKKLIVLFIIGGFLLSACNRQADKAAENNIKYTCPMHPQIVENKPGSCPICKMDLVPMKLIENDVIVLDSNQIKLGNIKTMRISENGFSATTTINGRLILNPENIAVLSSKFTGRVDQLFVKEIGVKIVKGQALYQIYSEDLLALQKEYLLNLKQQKAFPSESVYQKLVEASKNKLLLYGYSESKIENLALKEQMQANITVYAPQGGIISEINISEGQYVSEGSPIIKIENLNSLWVEGDLYAGENRDLKIGSPITLTVVGFENELISTKIDELSPQLNGNSQLLTFRAKITNPNHKFQPGMQANLNITSQSYSSDVISLPLDAVIRDQNGAHVWVKTGKGKFKQKMVEIGAATDQQVIIKKGVNKGEEIVISGAYLLTSEYILKKGGNSTMTM